MASNHTSNYNLNQWEPEDKVLREEFNEDNQKIDAALLSLEIGKLSYTVIHDVEVPEEIQQIEFDTNTNRWGQYSFILFVYVPGSGGSGILTLAPTDATIDTTYHQELTGSNITRREYLAEGSASSPLTVLFFPGKTISNTIQTLSFCAQSFFYGYSGVRYSYDQPLCLKASAIPAGSHIRIMGVL